jgi:YbbR domain-containing protein
MTAESIIKPVIVTIKGTNEVVLLEQAPTNQVVHTDMQEIAQPKVLPKIDAKATAKSAKVTLVLEPSSITEVSTEGKKQTKLVVTVGAMRFDAHVSSKSYRKMFVTRNELGIDNCNIILQASMTVMGKLESVGLAVQPKAKKAEEPIT